MWLWLLDFRWWGVASLVAFLAFASGDVTGRIKQKHKDNVAATLAENTALKNAIEKWKIDAQQASVREAATRESNAKLQERIDAYARSLETVEPPPAIPVPPSMGQVPPIVSCPPVACSLDERDVGQLRGFIASSRARSARRPH
jgi:hypothetical protein